MSTTATSQDSGFLNTAQAADAFEKMLDSPEDKPADPEQEETESEDDAEQAAELEGDESDEANESGEDEEKPALHTVKVDGKELQVPLEELVKGYQREADYTRKTMALAEQRKAAESEMIAIRQERENYKRGLEQVQAHIRQSEPQIDWARLAQENPAEWTRQRVMAQDRQTALQNAEAERARVAQAEEAEQEKMLSGRIEAGNKALAESIPEWKDAKKASTGKAALAEYLQTVAGFTPDELNQVYDHRPLLLARKAMLYDQLVEKRANLKPVPAAETVKPAKPGSASANSQSGSVVNAQKRLAKSGNVRDAAALFEMIL